MRSTFLKLKILYIYLSFNSSDTVILLYYRTVENNQFSSYRIYRIKTDYFVRYLPNLTKITAAQNKVALSYHRHRVCALYFWRLFWWQP